MENSIIIRLFKLTAQLLELHDENPFKIKSYTNAVFALEKTNESLSNLPPAQLTQIEGVGKSIAEKIYSISQTGSFDDLQKLLEKTPEGVLAMLNIKGIGPKKIRTIWKELGIESTEALLEACEENKIAKLKGFGEKTQENIKQSLLFSQAAVGKLLYAKAEAIAEELVKQLSEKGLKAKLTGQLARKAEIIEEVQLVATTDNQLQAHQLIDSIPTLQKNPKSSAPFAWRGQLAETGLCVEIHLVPAPDFTRRSFIRSASPQHLAYKDASGQTLLQTALSEPFEAEEAIYRKAGLPFIVPELREGLIEFELAKQNKLADLVTLQDLKGILHNHTTYSDGKHTLAEMAGYCKELGFEYVGISDHSKSAFYASGLYEDKVRKQHEEIDRLNKELAPFRIFKGIESDILNDGSLDYADDMLASFDFIVASIHANLKMDEQKATQRLIKAIENPYTTILGHATGRLLLRREGYPINHKMVIDACAANGVVIEINANPWRLDIDWRWLPYALEKGVMISINPDAHEMHGFHDMIYGVHVARKGGLTKDKTFNALSSSEIGNYLKKKRNSNNQLF